VSNPTTKELANTSELDRFNSLERLLELKFPTAASLSLCPEYLPGPISLQTPKGLHYLDQTINLEPKTDVDRSLIYAWVI
jgi:hypothetical protein